MPFDNKPNLNYKQFTQLSGDTLYLSGTNIICKTAGSVAGGTISSFTGYQVSGTTVFDTGGFVSALQIGCNTYAAITAIAVGADAKACGNGSIAIGYNSTAKATNEISIGINAGNPASSGSNNIGIGNCTLNLNTTGCANIAVGLQSMYVNCTGGNNVAVGVNSLLLNRTGSGSVAVGKDSLYCNTTGDINTAIGMGALSCNTTGCGNVGIGYGAGATINDNNKLYIANSSACNLIYGDFVNNYVQIPILKICCTPSNGNSGTDSTLVWNSTDKCIKILPYSSGGTSGGILTANNGLCATNGNVRLGGALTGNTTITGAYTLNFCNGAQINTSKGYKISGSTIFRTSPASLNTIFIGDYSGSNGVGADNIGIGTQTLYSNTSGAYNMAKGSYALYYNTIGSGNTANGYVALVSNVSGNNNVAIGTSALYYNTTGCDNIGIGIEALFCNSTGYSNVAINNSALWGNKTGCYNIGIGDQAGSSNQSGCHNIALGWQSLGSNVSGKYNVAIGCRAGWGTTGSGKLYIATGSTRNLIYGDFITNAVTMETICSTCNVCVGTNILMNSGVAHCIYIPSTTSTAYPLYVKGQDFNGAPSGAVAGGVCINGGCSSASSGTVTGGVVSIIGGRGNTGAGASNTIGGNVNIMGGNASTSGGVSTCGGDVCIASGTGSTSCGNVKIYSGTQLRLETVSGGLRVCGAFSGSSTVNAASTMTATNFILSSDERLKTCIEPIAILPVNVQYKQFEMISEPSQLRYGVIAQDLQVENPELVRTNDNGMLSVAYIDLLVKEIAYLKYKVNELEKRIV